jgi:uncharacterized membrane protein
MAEHASSQAPTRHPAAVFGEDTFGRVAERVARFFGTPYYIVGQSILVVLWIRLRSSPLGAARPGV